jgi:ribose transport system permease protein
MSQTRDAAPSTSLWAGLASTDWIVGQARWIALAIAVVVPGILNPNFRSYDNLQGFLQSIGILLILAMGQSFVLLIAGIDLSVGAVVAMGSVILAALLQAGWPLWGAVTATLASGLGVGILNGAGVMILKIPSFIVTFAFMGICFATGLMISGGNRIGLPSGSLLPQLASGQLWGAPLQIILALALLVAGTFALRHLPIGRHLYAVGGNPEAARLSGVSVGRATLVAFALSGFFASIAGVVYAARIVSGNPIGGGNLNLQSIAAAVIGGISLFGGRGTLLGACFGAILYSLIENVLNIYNVNPNITEIVAGAIVLLAGLVNVLTDSKRSIA